MSPSSWTATAAGRRRAACRAPWATSAAPTYLPLFFSSWGQRFLDGGIWANCPSTVALLEAIAVLDISPAEIELLSIGTTTEPFSIGRRATGGGLVHYGTAGSTFLLDAQVKAAQGEGADPSRYRIRSMNAIERTLRRALAVELDVLTRSTQFLATTAAACPFIGLFGTVWGIMKAFNDIGITGSTSITAVAPGIAGALINTAAGLAAAIPALVAYNTFSTRVKRLRGEMEDFVLEFMNLTERNFT